MHSSSVMGPVAPVPAIVLGISVQPRAVARRASYLDNCTEVRAGRICGLHELKANGKGVRIGPFGMCSSRLDPIEVAVETEGRGEVPAEFWAELSDEFAWRDIL